MRNIIKAIAVSMVLCLAGIAQAESTPFEAITYNDAISLDWELQGCHLWLGSRHNGECLWRRPDGKQQAVCFMWDIFTNNETMSCQLQNLAPGAPVNVTVPSKVKQPFPGTSIRWNDALGQVGFQRAECTHDMRMQGCQAYGDDWVVVCRLFQAAEQLRCRRLDLIPEA